MIKNDREYRITKAKADEFQRTLTEMNNASRSVLHPLIVKAQREAVESELEVLKSEIEEYEALRDGKRSVLEGVSLEELPLALIRARIAAGLTQRELGERLRVSEQQVQRYEATEYASASLSRLVEVTRALGVRLREDVFLPGVDVSRAALLRRLRAAGVDRDFARKFLLDSEEEDEEDNENDATSALRGAGVVQRVFGWTPAQVFAQTSTLTNLSGAQSALFKIHANATESRTIVLAAFAKYLVQLAIKATPSVAAQQVPRNAGEFRKAVLTRAPEVTLETVLLTLWDFGVLVLPFSEGGGFHGACWRIDGRNAIMLKQRTSSVARWLHDLLHEAHHAGLDPTQPNLVEIDEDAMPLERRKSAEEKKATKFAADVLLDGRAEELASACVKQAGKSVERLKKVVPQVAKQHGVDVGVLANYMAWRLSLQDIDWWGAAENLQLDRGKPWTTVRDFLVPRLDWSQLDSVERKVLTRALSE